MAATIRLKSSLSSALRAAALFTTNCVVLWKKETIPLKTSARASASDVSLASIDTPHSAANASQVLLPILASEKYRERGGGVVKDASSCVLHHVSREASELSQS